ncbi:MAG: hypothetical protein ABIG20_00070 [archaeon]
MNANKKHFNLGDEDDLLSLNDLMILELGGSELNLKIHEVLVEQFPKIDEVSKIMTQLKYPNALEVGFWQGAFLYNLRKQFSSSNVLCLGQNPLGVPKEKYAKKVNHPNKRTKEINKGYGKKILAENINWDSNEMYCSREFNPPIYYVCGKIKQYLYGTNPGEEYVGAYQNVRRFYDRNFFNQEKIGCAFMLKLMRCFENDWKDLIQTYLPLTESFFILDYRKDYFEKGLEDGTYEILEKYTPKYKGEDETKIHMRWDDNFKLKRQYCRDIKDVIKVFPKDEWQLRAKEYETFWHLAAYKK